MPNDVYRAAVDGLAALVPPKAARRLVDDSLRATRRTPDDVSVAAMRRLLLGPIRHELAGVLPPSAIGAGLKKIAAELHGAAPERRPWWRRGRRRKEDDADPEPDAPADEAEGSPVEEGPQAAVSVPLPALAAAAKVAATSGPAASVRSSTISSVPATEQAAIEAALATKASRGSPDDEREPVQATHGTGARRAPPPLPRLDEALLGRALKAFGELETVRQVVAVRGGDLVSSSGEGVDAEQLPGLVHATTRLLGRSGRLNVFALERPTGAMFLFPLTGGGLVVLTEPKVNFGAVLAARATLEEAA